MVQFEENSIYIVDDVELLEHIISQTVSDVQHDTNNPLFNQLEGQFYVTQRTYDEFDKVLPTVDYGNLSFCFEIVDNFLCAIGFSLIRKYGQPGNFSTRIRHSFSSD